MSILRISKGWNEKRCLHASAGDYTSIDPNDADDHCVQAAAASTTACTYVEVAIVLTCRAGMAHARARTSLASATRVAWYARWTMCHWHRQLAASRRRYCTSELLLHCGVDKLVTLVLCLHEKSTTL